MLKPQQLLMALQIVCQSWAPAPFSLKLFVAGSLLDMQEGTAVAWGMALKGDFYFLLSHAWCEQEKH